MTVIIVIVIMKCARSGPANPLQFESWLKFKSKSNERLYLAEEGPTDGRMVGRRMVGEQRALSNSFVLLNR